MSSQNATNLTSVIVATQWTTLPIVTLVTSILTFINNAALVTVYISTRKLRTPFGVLVMNLFMANLIYTVLQSPLDLYLYVTPSGHTQAFCIVYLYVTYTFPPVLPLCHLAITINRLWAVSRPMSYRRVHSHRMAVGQSLGLYALCHVFYLPGIIVDGLVYRTPSNNLGCAMNNSPSPQTPWKALTTHLFYVLPLIIMVACYPYFAYQRWKRLHQVRTDPESGPTSTKSDSQRVTVNRRRSSSFWILTLLIGSMVVCWTPMIVYFTLYSYVGTPMFYQVGKIMKLCQTVIDPLLFAVSLRDVRTACRDMLRRDR